jgi:predicted RNase H-like nuclease (RuvC/YqgF family)
MIYTGLESYTDAELIAMIERQDNPLAHELLRRSADVAKEIEDYKATITSLEVDLEEARERTGLAALEEKLGETRRDLKDAQRKATKLEATNTRMQANFNRVVAVAKQRIASLKRQIADAPATW